MIVQKYPVLLLIAILIQIPLYAKDFKGAEYRTKEAYTYGRFEVRMKSAHREGMLSSFFTYYDGDGSAATWNEIDFEIMGRYPNDIQFNTITPPQTNHVGHLPMTSSPHADYHTYAFEWTPDYVSWFVDGIEVLKQTGAHIQTLVRAQKIMMNIWNPQYTNWAGVLNPNTLPAFAYYDWVSYYSYTPGSGNYGTGNNFTHSWTDDFDYWNTARWDKATHTWYGNGCDFIYENAVFRDGKLILCLTDAINTGYTDTKSPSLLAARVVNGKVIAYFSEELDTLSARNTANYIINSATVTDAVLLDDQKSVRLSVEGWDFSTSKNLLTLNIKDRWSVPNTMSANAVTIIRPNQLTFPVKINCGGPTALSYLADQEWNYSTEYGYLDGSNTIHSSGIQINGTEEDEIFRSERYGMVTYKMWIPNGIYSVKLMFAENYFNSAGSRIFDVYVENERVAENLDVYAEAGKNTAYILDVPDIQVNDGILDIYFAAKVDNAFISGIVISAASTGMNDEKEIAKPDFKVEQNYPNPFNGKTVINYSLTQADNLILELYNVLGEQVYCEDLGYLQSGSYKYVIDSASLRDNMLSSSVYFYVIRNSNMYQTRKMILLN